jgi:long-chain acyl-CoA synthetase
VDKRWLEQYQQGVPYEINVDQYPSLVAIFDEACNKFNDSCAYENLGTQISFSELDTLSSHFASYLQQLGLQKGARVAVMMPNLLQYPIAVFGILRAGYVVVNTNPLYTSDEVEHQMNDSGAEVLIVLANFATTVEKALPNMHTIKHVIVTEIGDALPSFKRMIVNAVVKYVKKMVPTYHLPNSIGFRDAMLKGKHNKLNWVMISSEDIAFLQYTGGTTGVAKAATLTHENMVANVLQASAWIDSSIKYSKEIVVTALPLYHIFSLTANCLTFLRYGAKNILITNPRDIPEFIRILKKSKFSVITGVNTLFNALLNNSEFKNIDFTHLKVALSGGMSLQKIVALKWRAVTKKPVLEAYGLTETSPAVTINPLYLKEYNGSIGLPISSTEVSIRNEKGKVVAIGETGELCVKGPQVMKTYWNKPEETALVFTKDGFLKTGDIAKMDEEGFIYLVDRKKDMIIVSGFNVYPNEVEQIIGLCPGVLEVGVVGVKDNAGGEQVKACIVKKDPSLTAEQIIAHCREHLTAYKVPKIIQFYDTLPKTNVGKILRRALRE